MSEGQLTPEEVRGFVATARRDFEDQIRAYTRTRERTKVVRENLLSAAAVLQLAAQMTQAPGQIVPVQALQGGTGRV